MPEKLVRPSNPFTEFKKAEIEGSIPARFEQMVETYPDRLAAKDLHEGFTYAELNQFANGIAQTLWTETGEEENVPVCLLLGHHARMLGAILGVLKAGKCYVPLNPALPKEQLRTILEESGATSILTDNTNHPLAVELASEGVRIIQMDDCPHADSNSSAQNVPSPKSLVSISYTSGSTGKPKGVVQNQRNVLHTIMNYTNDFHINQEDKILLLYSYAFTASAKPIFGALLNGAAVFVFDLSREGLTELPRVLSQEKATGIHMSASFFRNFCDLLKKTDTFPDLRFIYTGNEPVKVSDVELYKAHFSPSTLFVITYAATETSDIRRYFVNHSTQIPSEGLHVGYSVLDKEVLLLDEDGNEVPPESTGEIAVRSEFLFLEYWKQPELTQAALLPDPKGENQQLYRTGDLGRFGSDGGLYHLGRKDFQVKIRGYKVETGEVETRLLELDEVKEAVVHGQTDHTEGTRLVAYIIPSTEHEPKSSVLRQQLSQTLPTYKIPSAFIIMEALPLTPNGKVDRRALPVPGSERPELEAPFVAPSTPLEKSVAKIWGDVLGIDKVGIHDPFLELGGDSFRAMQLISRVLDKFHVDIPIQALMQTSTVAETTQEILFHLANQVEPDEIDRLLDQIETS